MMARRPIGLLVVALSLAVLAGRNISADEGKQATVQVGDPAPKFTATDDQGQTWKLSEHEGKSVLVLYFFPADFTGGCTKQACGFRDDFSKLADKGVTVIGISGDSARTHALFKKAHQLPFTLLADKHGHIAKKFGVPTRAGGQITVTVDGKDEVIKRGATDSRWTFVIGKDGKVLYKNEKVSPAEDSKRILALVEKLEK
jgi:peroxiredoxin Q/BCP